MELEVFEVKFVYRLGCLLGAAGFLGFLGWLVSFLVRLVGVI